MDTNSQGLGYSADVRMKLRINGSVLDIGQLGPDFIILDKPLPHPPSEAEIAVSINGHERRWKVYLPDGIATDSTETKTLS
jgi:hypothetical protein